MELHTLHGIATNGKTKVWKIEVIPSEEQYGIIRTTHGYLNGEMQVNDKIISKGKNIGKKNETTPLQQAINEALSTMKKKEESGYTLIHQSENGFMHNQISKKGKGITDSAPLPMLAHDYSKRGHNIQYPCFVQRKYDGTRCIGMPHKGLYSRNRKQFPHLEHIIAELNQLPEHLVLDGELYSQQLSFQEIVGLVKRETLKADDNTNQLKIQFYVYDIISEQIFEERYATLLQLFERHSFEYIVFAPTQACNSELQMKELHAQYVSEGYEGIMLRNKNGLYKNSRSADLQKYKEFFDEDFEVVGFREGEGLEQGCVIWVCKTKEGQLFHCRPRGTREDRIELFQCGNDYVGKYLTIRFQEWTNEQIPRFPVGITFRDYE
jgi:DNA ligase-1